MHYGLVTLIHVKSNIELLLIILSIMVSINSTDNQTRNVFKKDKRRRIKKKKKI